MFAGLTRDANAGLFVYAGGATNAYRQLIVDLARQNAVPSVDGYRYFVDIGGLVSYGVDSVDQYHRAASYVDRILRGAKAGDLPVQRPVKFELVVNKKVAKELDLVVPTTLLAVADDVIE